MDSKQLDFIADHMHTPSKFKNPFIRFLSFLFRSKKLFRMYDYTSTCAFCNNPIRYPMVLFSWRFNFVCSVMASLLTIPWALLGIHTNLIFLCFLSPTLLQHFVNWIAVSFVLSFFPWREYDPSTFNEHMVHTIIQTAEKKRLRLIAVGILAAALITWGLYTLIY